MSWQMWAFIVIGIIGVLITAGGFLGSRVATKQADKDGMKMIGGFGTLVIALGAIILATGCFTIVGTRQVGIETAFNRPTGKTFENGLNFKAPWASVVEMDGAIQINKYEGDNAIRVRLGNNSTAGADTSIRWRIKQDAADELFVDYKTFDNVRVNLIERNLQVAENEVFQSFDPLDAEWAEGVPLQQFADKAAAKLKDLVGQQVEIIDVSVSRLDYDEQTEGKINQLNAERANTAVAKQAKDTATAQAEANRELASSVSNDPNVIVANCITKALDKGVSPFGCWPTGGEMLLTVPAPVK
ncbi:band-7-like membrane protein [Mycobacterium phage Bongo]|uniref:Band-7-like membrane protein n=4 Tax=Bongovirus bongo TaxID=1983750 RepID=A0A0M4RAA7_9CAUD|nr:lipoprotein [Mycobacterium phage Bongo]ALF00624.1 band-7-like membrane protein [Mycobacterium phage Bricole]AXQ52736.1 band-7-like membrane protein [Mycobacterium phage IPhane7]QGJ93239.1 membrane protein [Mycobacterium phage TyDawg]WNM75308.1 band-7-like membrane protein [Mycobacterium phage Auspice]AER26138.1 band-7-like membrane protein [Mycobacterium phage Bongo]